MTYTEWEFSNTEPKEYAKAEEGLQYARIEDAVYDPETKRVKLYWRSLKNGAGFPQTLFMLTKNGADNGMSIRLLREIGAAGYGVSVDEGTPAPQDLIGLTLMINVILEPDKKDASKIYARATEFYPLQEEDLDKVPYREDQYYQINQ